jgi:hypothetical protein
MKSNHGLLSLVAATILSSCWSLSAASPDDEWTGWRARQQAELATLPKPQALPKGAGSPIDRFLGVEAAPVGDAAFARRVYLDVIGLPPTIEQLDQFVNDQRPDKRTRLVDALLADKQGYAEHWMTFWNDLLRNDEQTNIDGLRKPITPWLYQSLLDQMRLLSQQLHQPLEAGGILRHGQLFFPAELGNASLR